MKVTAENTTEVTPGRFVTEASTLGLRPGQAYPIRLATDMGNHFGFILKTRNEEGATYHQAETGLTLNVLND